MIFNKLAIKIEEMAEQLKSNPPPGIVSLRDYHRGLDMLLSEITWHLKLNRNQRYIINKKTKNE